MIYAHVSKFVDLNESSYFAQLHRISRRIIWTYAQLFPNTCQVLNVANACQCSIAKIIYYVLILLSWQEWASAISRRAWLLEFEASFVDCGWTIEFLDVRIDTQVLPRAQSKMSELFG